MYLPTGAPQIFKTPKAARHQGLYSILGQGQGEGSGVSRREGRSEEGERGHVWWQRLLCPLREKSHHWWQLSSWYRPPASCKFPLQKADFFRAAPVPAVSQKNQLKITQNDPYAKEARFGVAYSAILHKYVTKMPRYWLEPLGCSPLPLGSLACLFSMLSDSYYFVCGSWPEKGHV